MSERLDLLTEAYLDGTLDAAEAEELASALRGGGEAAAAIRERVALTGLLGQAFDEAGADAVARSVDERIEAERRGSAFVRAVRGSLPRRRRRLPLGWLSAAAALVLLAFGAAWWATQQRHAVPVAECRIAAVAAGSTIQRGDERFAAIGGADLLPGDLAVAAGACTVRYPDGTELALAAGARLRVLASDAGKRALLAFGELEAEIAPQPAGQPFVIATGGARVEVVGTRFTLATGSGRTRLDLRQGTVRLVRSSDGSAIAVHAGQTASVAVGEDLAAHPTGQELFPANGLDGWTQQHGSWSNQGGVVRGDTAGGDKARLISVRDFRDLELTCRLRISGAQHGEVQVGDYNWFFTIPAGGGEWIALRLSQQGEGLSCTTDGVALRREAGSGRRSRPGPLAFYVMTGGVIEIAEARVREAAP